MAAHGLLFVHEWPVLIGHKGAHIPNGLSKTDKALTTHTKHTLFNAHPRVHGERASVVPRPHSLSPSRGKKSLVIVQLFLGFAD